MTDERISHPTERNEKDKAIHEALRSVKAAMETVQYGEIIVKMQGGKPVWVDKIERERVG